jgi:hypothetical protein
MRCTYLFLFVYDVVGGGDVRVIDPFLLSSVSRSVLIYSFIRDRPSIVIIVEDPYFIHHLPFERSLEQLVAFWRNSSILAQP